MSATAGYANGGRSYGPTQWVALVVWILSYTWIVLKDASWLGAIGLIGLATCAASSVAMRTGHAK